MTPQSVDVAIIGAGASGTLTALQVARTAGGRLRGSLIEAGARAARGLAYGTPYGAHLLNVPAAKMSAFPDDPDHFLRWLRARLADAGPGTFAPRALYGDYLAWLLHDGGVERCVSRVGGTAVGLTRESDRWIVHLHDGRVVDAAAVVLALGNLPPADPIRFDDDPPVEYVRDPWAPGASIGLDPKATVLLIGSGLTAVDVAVALRHEGHAGRMIMLSRRGRLPHPHAPYTPRPLEVIPAEMRSPRSAMRWLRRQLAEGAEWRALVDSLRPHTRTIWQQWSLAQRSTFVRHLKNLWDVHRHRAAASVHEAVDAEILRGRPLSLRRVSEGVEVTWHPFGRDTETMVVSRVINCTGPASDYARVDLPLVAQMRRAGWLVPDSLRLGIETGEHGRLVGADGKPVAGLFTLGPLRRAALWESTAIPEIRDQAAELAQHISAELRGGSH